MWGEQLTISLFGVTILGSVIVAAIVEKLKGLLKTEGWVNTLIALLVGVALGGALYLVQLALVALGFMSQVQPILLLLGEGFFSGGVAAGLWKAAKTLGKKK